MKEKNIVLSLYKVIAAIAAIILIFFSCKNDISVVNSLTIKEKSPIETATKMHLYFSEFGIVRNEFIFEEMNKYNDPESYSEYPKGVKLISYDENKEKEISLTANYAINYEERNIMEAKYNVVITNFKTGEIIETEHLLWDMDKHVIYSNTQTKQTKADGSVYIGDSFESDEQFSKYTIFNPQIIFYAEE
ncbi:MAG: LPS export ABC transporter periplasmic protein LptC [Bacteroidales bacterium]|jgi:LPS export ABC transporter protein LptC|nr:LPS export ABC transporter periplasmic protein LptC [Bacteroidales bacterium]